MLSWDAFKKKNYKLIALNSNPYLHFPLQKLLMKDQF